jgi:hypothetical protein
MIIDGVVHMRYCIADTADIPNAMITRLRGHARFHSRGNRLKDARRRRRIEYPGDEAIHLES